MNETFSRWDSAEYLKTAEDVVAYLDAALEEDDAALLATALGNVARSQGMSDVARNAGLSREGLYKALAPDGNPSFATVVKVLAALGLQLSVRTRAA